MCRGSYVSLQFLGMPKQLPTTFSRLPDVAEDDCIFCQIVRGDTTAARVAETDTAIAFLDINPIVRGHTLVIPRSHAIDLLESSPAELAGALTLVRSVALAIVEGLSAAGVSVWQTNGHVAGQTVPHTHFHILPRSEGDRGRVLPDRRSSDLAELSELALTLSARVRRRSG